MRRPLVNTWGIVAPQEIHVIIATLTTLLAGIVTVVVIVVTVIGTATIMEETEIGAIAEAPLLHVAVDTPLTIGVAEATPAAHLLEEAALHLVAEGVVVVAQETTTRLPEEALLLLQHLMLNTRGGEDLTPSSLANSSQVVVPQLGLAPVNYPVACGFCVCLVLFIFSCSLFFSWSLSFSFSFYLTVSLYVLSLRWPWSLSWACKMCKAKICVEEKSFYIQIIMKNNGD